MSDFSDPWSVDYFNPPTPKVEPKGPKIPKPIPEPDRLFQVQRNALKALNRVQQIEQSVAKTKDVDPRVRNELQLLEKDIENTYRVIRSWLVEHT